MYQATHQRPVYQLPYCCIMVRCSAVLVSKKQRQIHNPLGRGNNNTSDMQVWYLKAHEFWSKGVVVVVNKSVVIIDTQRLRHYTATPNSYAFLTWSFHRWPQKTEATFQLLTFLLTKLVYLLFIMYLFTYLFIIIYCLFIYLVLATLYVWE